MGATQSLGTACLKIVDLENYRYFSQSLLTAIVLAAIALAAIVLTVIVLTALALAAIVLAAIVPSLMSRKVRFLWLFNSQFVAFNNGRLY